MKPLCFVIMPFGKKKDAEGNEVDFDVVYKSLIRPDIEKADMEPIRADEETVNGIIHKPMYERLILCDYAVADLTTANANVFYELGVRHAVKPYTTITIFSSNSKLPFDVNFLRTMPYKYDGANYLTNTEADVNALTKQLLNAKKEQNTDSPVYQLVEGIAFQNSVAHEKTDIFRARVKYNEELKEKLAQARKAGTNKAERIAAVDNIIKDMRPIADQEAGVLIDAMLSYRSLGAFDKMISFIREMPAHIEQTVMVQEQLGFALNRVNKKDEAINVLEKLIKDKGPSSETCGILGRVYKDQFDEALNANKQMQAEGFLDKAAETYLQGFNADPRDAYPGVNAATLLELKGEKDTLNKIVPVVEYAVLRKMEKKKPDYWDFATLLELAVIRNDEPAAKRELKRALATTIEGDWMFETTIRNLKLIEKFRKQRTEDASLAEKMIGYLSEEIKVGTV